MPKSDTDQQDKAQSPAEALLEFLGDAAKQSKGKQPQRITGWVQVIVGALMVLGGTGIGQTLFGVSKETLREELKKETAPLLSELEALRKQNTELTMRVTRLETKLDK